MDSGEIASRIDKKIARWGPGWVVFITTEAKKLGWKYGQKVSVTTVRSKEGDKIVIERI